LEPRRLISGWPVRGKRFGSTNVEGNVSKLEAGQCRALAQEYKDRAREPSAPQDTAFIMKNIARSLMGLATQLDMLAAKEREKTGRA
jgi:hypothetical protein